LRIVTGFQRFHLFIIILLINGSVFANPLVRLTSGEWPPYLSQALPNGGFATKIITEAFFEQGINVEIGYYPWKRSYNYALTGKDPAGKTWNGTMVWVHTDDRAKSFFYSDAVVVDEEVLFYLSKSPLHWKSVSDLEGKTLGGTAHTAYPAFEKAEKQGRLTIQRGGNYDTLLKRVYNLKIEAAPIVKQVGLYYLKHNFSPAEQKQFSYSPTVIEKRYYHLILSKNVEGNAELMEAFNKGLAQLHRSGRYKQLLSQLRRGNF